MERTIVDEFIDFKYNAIQKMRENKDIMALLSNNPDIDLEGEEAEQIYEDCFYDHSFADSSFKQDKAAIFVEAACIDREDETTFPIKLYIQIVCNRGFIKLDNKIFKGLKGNRQDNIARYIAETLDGDDDYGIGSLKLYLLQPSSVPEQFSSLQMEFNGNGFIVR